jgi:hypothetical protein
MDDLLRKDVLFKWDDGGKISFKNIKEAITLASFLVNLNYSRDFIIFSFASKDIIVGVLFQKNKENNEQPIAFMSKKLRDIELKYIVIEKQAYAPMQPLKQFRSYVEYNQIIAYVPYPIVMVVLAQQDCLGVIGKWVSKIQEYDLNIKPTKIIKGQGLAKMLTRGK